MARTNGTQTPQQKTRQQWFWQKNRLNKPPLLYEGWRKGYARIPYEKMHQDELGYYIDANDSFELTTLAIKNPRYFDEHKVTKEWRLRKRPKSRLNLTQLLIWFSVGLNLFFAGANAAMTIFKLGH